MKVQMLEPQDADTSLEGIQRFCEDYNAVRVIVPKNGMLELIHVDQTPKPLEDCTEFRQRTREKQDQFNVVLTIPTGIGCEVGGHAGDAGPLTKLFGPLCDNLITHPNVVNGSDINEMTPNTMYVEGSILTRLLMGTCGLNKVRTNRVLTILDYHEDPEVSSWSINSVNAAVATYGFTSVGVHQLKAPVQMFTQWSESGCASGHVEEVSEIVDVMWDRFDDYDAIAICTPIHLENWESTALSYLKNGGVNPWGGIEACLTHTLSLMFDKPCAHAPMVVDKDEQQKWGYVGIVDPRMAAECVSVSYLNCVLKGLMVSPSIGERDNSDITAENVHVLIQPDKVVGLPTLAAMKQGIPIIAVTENDNIMMNSLEDLGYDKLTIVQNYWEAAGLVSCMRAGINPQTVRRPLQKTELSGRPQE